ncbi:hypothetical protein [Streptomyces omiyaensis]|uniref:Lipoprotein n=1 Tax=Streptomyces omiyaensis TaxID=68247 RepID=A0ABW7BZ78_9ACTN|nr:hypothetical protein [Streptomyces omiyaensis]GGY64760.1 hypothetical protein GCM10010363_52680 [Streptomyces omiyaensis]
MIHTTSVRAVALAAAALAALAVSCGTSPEPDARAEGPAATATTTAPEATEPTGTASAAPEATTDAPTDASTPGGSPTPGGSATPGAADGTPYPDAQYSPFAGELVRDAFATLQATLNDSCASDCSYFLRRVNKELQELDWAMKNDPKGPGHFPEPLQKMAELNRTLAGDSSFENLKKHQKKLIGTRDFINTWMQDHPDDYR